MTTLREAAQQAMEAEGCERLREWAAIGPVQRAAVESFLAAALAQQEQEPVAWKHDCAALLQNDVELWIDQCPHCGKPATPPPQPKRRVTYVCPVCAASLERQE